MDEKVVRQHVVSTLESLKAVAQTNKATVDVVLVLDTALASLALPANPVAPAAAANVEARLEAENETVTVVPAGFDSAEEALQFCRDQGMSEESADAFLQVAVDPETGEVPEGTNIPDIVGNITDEDGNIVKTIGDAATSIQAANAMLDDLEDAHEAMHGERTEDADARTVTLHYKRLDEQEMTEADIETILADSASDALRQVMGDFTVALNVPSEHQNEREVVLSFASDSEENLKPTALLYGLVGYRGITSIPGIGGVSVETRFPTWLDAED